ncbi:YOR378W-like protein [Aureobasidium subglaciale]|nr:YOR378W-like protein [Aureobasidium subglaciale]
MRVLSPYPKHVADDLHHAERMPADSSSEAFSANENHISRTEFGRSETTLGQVSNHLHTPIGQAVSFDFNLNNLSIDTNKVRNLHDHGSDEAITPVNGEPRIEKSDLCAPPPLPETQPEAKLNARELLFIITVCMAQFLTLGGLGQSVAPLFIIGKDLGVADTNLGTLSWYTAAFSLTVGAFILPAGRLGDMYGHKKMFIIGWIWYAVTSIIVGFSYAAKSNGSVMLSVTRGFQGIGPAILVPNAMALVGTTFPMGLKRNMVFSAFGACGPTGFVFGAIFSALLSQFASPIFRGPNTSTFDFAGACTGVSGLVLFNFALNQAPVVGWNKTYIPFTLGIGVMLLIAFVYLEMNHAQQALVPIRGLSKEAVLALSCIAAGWSSHGIWLFYLFQFVQRFRGSSAIAAAAQISPVAITGVGFAMSAGWLARKFRTSYIMLCAMLGFFIGTLFLAFVPVHQTYWVLTLWSVVIMPIGMNWSFPSGTILLSNAMAKEHQGIAASLVSTVVNYSISIGLGIAGTVERYVSEKHGPLWGIRGAWCLALGLDAIGVGIAVYFVVISRRKSSS